MKSPDLKQNYFELFGLAPTFEIDRERLQQQQRSLQANYHPDRHVNGSDRDKRLSMQLASWINQAYETLQDPVKRARYLLEISGAEIPDDSTTTADTEFLMEQIELREQVEACRQHEDGLQRSEQIDVQLQQRARNLGDEFVAAFAHGDYASATIAYRKMQFIQRIQQQLGELQFELEGL
jgi:molecular chaperone HscB